MNATAARNTAAQLTAVDMLMGTSAYADLTKRFNREMAWQNACTAYAIRQTLGEAYNPEPKGMPSKAHKHQMYADASRVMSILQLTVKRPSTLAEVADVIAEATAVLTAR